MAEFNKFNPNKHIINEINSSYTVNVSCFFNNFVSRPYIAIIYYKILRRKVSYSSLNSLMVICNYAGIR